MTSIIRAIALIAQEGILKLLGATNDSVVADTNGTAVDLLGMEGSLLFIGFVSHGTGTGSAILKVEGSADGSTGWAAITGLTTVANDANTPKGFEVVKDIAELPRYVRAVRDVTGTTEVSGLCYAIGLKKSQ